MTTKLPKVLLVSTSDTDGGAARAAYRIHLSQKMRGVESHMFVKYKKSGDPDVIDLDTFTPHNPLYKAYDWLRNKVQNKVEHARWNQYPDREKAYMSNLRGTDLHGALHKLDYDLLHLHWVNQRFIPLSQLPQNKPIVWTLHDSWPFCGTCHYFQECTNYRNQCGNCPRLHSHNPADLSHQIWLKKKAAYQHLNLHIVSPSNWLADCARQSSLLGQFPVTVIPNCLDTDAFRPLDSSQRSARWQSLAQQTEGKKILLYGAINAATDKRKGYAHLLAALQHLEATGRADNMALVVFGAKRSDLDINLKMPIHYLGFVSDTLELVSLYSMADLTVVPSLDENLSCAIMESLACATPVVAFNIGGNSDMIDHQQNGYLAKERDTNDLADGIDWCLSHNADNSLGQKSRATVMERFTYEAVGKQYLQLYQSLVGQKA